MTRRNLLLLASFVPAVVAACGPFAGDDSEEEEPARLTEPTSGPVELSLILPDASSGQTREMTAVLGEETFAGQYTVQAVPLRPTGGQTYSEAVAALAAAGTNTDLIWMDQFALPTLAGQGVTRDLGEFTRRDIDFSTDDFWPHILSSGAYRGTLHALPLAASVCTIMYNPALFARANVPLPAEDWNWQAFLTLAQALDDQTATPRVWGALQAPLIPPFFALAWQEGSTLFQDRNWDVTHAGVISALQYQADLILRHEVAPPLSVVDYRADNLTLNLTNRAQTMILNGQIAMTGGMVNAEVYWRGSGRASLELVSVPRGSDAATWGMVAHMAGVAQESAQADAAYEILDPLLEAASLVLSMPAIRMDPETLRSIHQTLTVNDSLVLLESMEQSQYIDADAPEWLAFLMLASLVFPVLTGQATAQQAAKDTQEAIQMQLNAEKATPTN